MTPDDEDEPYWEICPECDGTGIDPACEDYDDEDIARCPVCDGEGEVKTW